MIHSANKQKRIIVLDTSAFVAGFDPFSLSEQQVTVPLVEEEIKRNAMIRFRFETAMETGKIQIMVASQVSQNNVKSCANKVGDSFKLSNADLQILALASDLKDSGFIPQIMTDDYSIQNVATQLGIEFSALITFGIKRIIEWIRYCPACHKEYSVDSKFKECQVCGSLLKRKPRKTLTKSIINK
jgi:endoribonuclease Nob1